MSEDHQDTKKEAQLYFKVFGALAALTMITVAISFLNVGITIAIFLALLVAVTKASFVCSFFMHLLHEKKIVYLILVMTVFFFTGMMGLIIYARYSVPEGTRNLNLDDRYKTSSKTHDTHHTDGGGDYRGEHH